MQSTPPTGVEATFLIITIGLSLLFVVVAFLAHRTGRADHKTRKYMQPLSSAFLALGGLFAALTVLELAFRLVNPGGYFELQPLEGHNEEAITEKLANGQAFWEYRATYGFDEGGYREKFEEPVAGGLKLVVLGDSVTYGVYVEYEDTFVYKLRQELAKRCGPVNLYNLAVPGYSTLQERIALERKGLTTRPDVVFLGVFPNDLAQFTLVGNMAYDIRIKDIDGVPVFSLLPLPDGLNRFLVSNSVFYQFLTLRGVAALDQATGRELGQLEASLEELERIRELTVAANGRLVVALFPMLDVDLSEPEPKSTQFYYGKIRAWAEGAGVAVIEPRTALSRHEQDEIKVDECCHYSPYGHQVVADTILEQLMASGVLPDRCALEIP